MRCNDFLVALKHSRDPSRGTFAAYPWRVSTCEKQLTDVCFFKHFAKTISACSLPCMHSCNTRRATTAMHTRSLRKCRTSRKIPTLRYIMIWNCADPHGSFVHQNPPHVGGNSPSHVLSASASLRPIQYATHPDDTQCHHKIPSSQFRARTCSPPPSENNIRPNQRGAERRRHSASSWGAAIRPRPRKSPRFPGHRHMQQARCHGVDLHVPTASVGITSPMHLSPSEHDAVESPCAPLPWLALLRVVCHAISGPTGSQLA